MSFFKMYLSILFFMPTLIIYSSQDSMIVFSSGQKHLYSKKILTEDVLKNFQDMQVAFNAKDYRLAAMLGVGASRYAHIMALPQIDPVVAKIIDFIVAASHMKLNSPQHALSAFENIHDKETKYGIITSTDIAMCFASKKETLLPENPLFQKLSEYIDTFEQYAAAIRIASYKKEYTNCDLDQLIKKVRLTRDSERLSVLVSAIKEYAKNNNVRALCIMTAAYNTGQYGISVCKKTALEYAQRYVAVLASSEVAAPLEHFGVKHALSNSVADNNQQAFISLSYCDYLYAVKQNNIECAQQAILELKKVKDNAAPLRAIVLDICASHLKGIITGESSIKMLIKMQSHKKFNDMINNLLSAEGAIIIPLLKVLHHNTQDKNMCYVLGILLYYAKDYINAKNYFCNKECKTFPHNIAEGYVSLCNDHINKHSDSAHIESLLAFIKKINSPNSQQVLTYSLMVNHIIAYCQQHLSFLLQNNHFGLAQRYSQFFLGNPCTMPAIINALSIIVQSEKNVYGQINELHPLFIHYLFPMTSHFCKCIIAKNVTAELLISLIKLFLSYKNDRNKKYLTQQIVICLKNIEANKQDMSLKRTTVGKFYYLLGKEYNSIDYFDKAIALGHVDAIYEKILLLLEQPHTQNIEIKVLALLKEHAQSSSELRHLSLYKLGELYCDYAV